jgi:hypothetical protein
MKVRSSRNSGQRSEFDRSQHDGLSERIEDFQPYALTLQRSLCECGDAETRKFQHGALTWRQLSVDFAVVFGLHGRRLHEQFAFLNLQKSLKAVK